MRRGDERAVTVQVGAVLLLGILLTAFALYQVNVVPAENQEVEFNHNERVQGEMQDLRNAIQNVGSSGGSQSTSITLGDQYPTRTFTPNPPNPSGTLETTEPNAIAFDDVEVREPEQYAGNIGNLLNERDTTTLRYEPNYREYSQPPVTWIEHGFVFNEFGDEAVDLTSQPVVDGTNITIVQIDGDISERSSGTVSVDASLESGPTDSIPIEAGSDGYLEIPTQTPNAWNESIDETNVTVSEYTGESLVIDLEEDEYQVQMACVTVGDGTGDTCGDFDITEEADDPQGEGNMSDLPGPKVTGLELDPESVTEGEGDEIDIEADFSNIGTTDKPRGGTPITQAEWYIKEEADPELGEGNSLDPATGNEFDEREEEAEGEIETDGLDVGEYTVSVRAQDTRGIWTNESDDDDRLTATFEVEEDENGGNGEDPEEDDPNFKVSIDDTNSPIEEGETLKVNATITNEDGDGTQDITLDIDEEGVVDTRENLELGPDESDEVTLTWDTEVGDDGEDIDATVQSDNDSQTVQVTVEQSQAGQVVVTPNVENAGGSGKLEFELENTGDVDVVMTGLGINETTNDDIDRVITQGGGQEGSLLETDPDTVLIGQEIDIDSSDGDSAELYDFNEDVTLDQQEEKSFEFDRFQEGDDNVNMGDVVVTITLAFEDESSTQIDLDPNADD